MKKMILLAPLVLFFLGAIAQNAGTVSGRIVKTGNPIEGATVSLLRAKDSATIKLAASGKDGFFEFGKVVDGKYLVGVTAVGHQKVISGAIEIGPQQRDLRLPNISLSVAGKDLEGVTVIAKKQLIEQRIDRTIVNVDASITNIGTSALEVLEKSPGVSVDRDGNISLKGKEGVLVMVDGRPTQLGAADLANLLRNMSSNQLDQIEIMTTPPARYDAAGTSGIINIKTKKNVTAGMNGSASVGYSQGKYPKTNEGFNFNYRNGKLNMFTNLSHNYMKRFMTMRINRNILSDNTGVVEKIFNQEANRVIEGNAYNAKVGVDFFADKKTTFGAVVNIASRKVQQNNPNVTNIMDASKVLESITKATVRNETDWSSFNANLNFRRLLDQKGKEITSDVDVAKHRMENNVLMVNSYTGASGNSTRKGDTLTGLLPQAIDVYSARIDYLHPISKDARFEAGIKSSFVKTDNNASYDSIQNGTLVHDFRRSNHFVYEENINAVYANISAPLSGKLTAQLGLRLENTNAKGLQKSTGEKFDRHYTQLFPTLFFQYKKDDKNTFGANFGRRVRRPSYQSLNPFINFIDRYTYSQGNPNLRPSMSNNFELSHNWKNLLTTTLNYTNVKDLISEVIQQKGQEAYNMPANVSSLNQFGIAISANHPINKWWTSTVNINVSNDHYKGIVNNAPIALSATSFVFNGTQQFKITKTFTAELNGMWRSGWLEGVMRVKAMGIIGAGVSQQVLKNQGMLRLSVRDMFHTQKLKGKSQYSNVDVELNQFGDTQVFTIGFSYNFSKGKKMAPVKRTTGSATEEQNRIGQ
ncbi:MAG: TonB-dependent receptor [Bacteroidota bacterium]